MTPREAGAIADALEEPDWREAFALRAACDDAFESTLNDWRHFHAVPVMIDGKPKRRPAPAVDGIVALAALHLFPPRDIPRPDGLFVEPHDAHCWLVVVQRAWRIQAIEDGTLFLDSFGEKLAIDLGKVRWTTHNDAAVRALRAAYPQAFADKVDEASCYGNSSATNDV